MLRPASIMSPPGDAAADRWRVNATADSHFAWIRTKFAVDRTFLAWLRTAVSLIGFGFTIVQFFSAFARMKEVGPAHVPRAPVYLGLTLVGAGTLALAIALIQYVRTLHHLEGPEFAAIADRRPRLDPAIWLAGALLMIGVVAFVAIVGRGVLEGP